MKRTLIAVASALFVFGFLMPASQASATPPVGALLNPSVSGAGNGPGTIISDQKDGTDALYHFTVRAAPTTAGATISTVRIQIRPPGAGSLL